MPWNFLTKDQQRAVQHVRSFISKTNFNGIIHKPLRLLVSSSAGTGKTITVSSIIALLDSHNIGYQVTSFTGNTSSALNGRTIHSLWGLKYKSSDFEKLAVVPQASYIEKCNFRSVHFLIIEEIYLLSPVILYFISCRLKLIFNNSLDFGGLSIIAAGCNNQLYPVIGGPLFRSPNGLSACQQEGIRLYKTLDTVVILKKNIRQKSDIPFQDLLNNLKLKQVTQTNVDLLNTRLYKNLPQSEQILFDSSIHLFPFNRQVRECNYHKLWHSGIPILKVDRRQYPLKPLAEINDLYIGKGVRICLNSNLDLKNGLYRGLQGTIESWVFDKGSVAVILCKFPSYQGKTVQGLVPIIRTADYFWDKSKKIKIKVHFFNIIPFYSCTVHISQGRTIERCAIDIGVNESFVGLSYTALSRAKSLSTLCILNDSLNLDRFTNYSFMKGGTENLQEILRLTILENNSRDISSSPAKRRNLSDDFVVSTLSDTEACMNQED